MASLIETAELWASEFNLDAKKMLAYAAQDDTGGEGAGWPGGSVWDVEGRLLYALIRAAGVETVLEFGTGHGCSTTHIARALHDNGRGVVITLDKPDSIDIASYHVPWPYDTHVARVLEDGLVWIKRNGGYQFDLTFEDGPHTFEFTRDAVGLSLPHLGPGGFVLVHDVCGPHEAQVWPGLRAALPDARRVLVEPSPCGLGYWRKPSGRTS